MKNYKLSYASLGNGWTVWNSLKEVSGDYEKIAHISTDGTMKIYRANPSDQLIADVESIRLIEIPDFQSKTSQS